MRSPSISRLRGSQFLIYPTLPSDSFSPEDFTPEERLISEAVSRFVAENVLPEVERVEKQDLDFVKELLRKAAGLGFLGIEIPEKYGGLGLDPVAATIAAEKMGAVASFSVAYGGHCGIGTLPLVYFGTEEQKQHYLPGLASGEMIGAYALTEAEAGSDALGGRARADWDGNRWVLNGEKLWITNAAIAGLLITFAKIHGKDLTAFLVEPSFPGVSLGKEESKMGIKGSSTRALILQNAAVPSGNLLGEAGKGQKIALNTLNFGRLKLSASCLGSAKFSLSEAIQYALQRQQFGRPISEFGAIQEKLARMAVKIWIAESILYRTADLVGAAMAEAREASLDDIYRAAREYSVECSILKVWTTEMLDFVVDEMVQIFGGNGYSSEYPAERCYRDSRVNRIFEGTNEINRLAIAIQVLKRSRENGLVFDEKAGELASNWSSVAQDSRQNAMLLQEADFLQQSRKLLLLLFYRSQQRFADKLPQQQEILMELSNILSEIYVLESGLLRALKIQRRDPSRGLIAGMLVRSFAQESLERIIRSGRKVLGEIFSAREQQECRRTLDALAHFWPTEGITLRREIAAELLRSGRYHF
ncbi:MAG: acyl-CoA dehydrogenase family protein [Acidobacteria bacterium]|nr:acyl-CoA dehydrogenase family protein [Acidobacteriota bacterium]